jgi:hypothetical protein
MDRSCTEGSALGSAVTALIQATATATATAGAAGIEAVAAAAAIAAILPATGTGTSLGGALSSVAATTTARTARTAAAVATATATSAAGLSLVDTQRAAHQLDSLQGFNRPGLGVWVRQLHKSETALATGVPLQRQGTADDFAIRGKELRHIFLLGAERQVADKNTH